METLAENRVEKMNATLTTIFERRAVRKYRNDPVPRQLIERLLDAARMAPSAMNRQPWKFYVVTSKTVINTCAGQITKAAAGHYHLGLLSGIISKNYDVFHGAPVVIFITAPPGNEWAQLDTGMCAQNIMLAAKSLGLDTCPVGFGKFIEETEAAKALGISKKEKVLLSIVIGYGNEKPELHPRIKNNAVFID